MKWKTINTAIVEASHERLQEKTRQNKTNTKQNKPQTKQTLNRLRDRTKIPRSAILLPFTLSLLKASTAQFVFCDNSVSLYNIQKIFNIFYWFLNSLSGYTGRIFGRREHPGGFFLYNCKFCISSIGAEAMIRGFSSQSVAVHLSFCRSIRLSVRHPSVHVRPSVFQFLQSLSGKRPWLTRHQTGT